MYYEALNILKSSTVLNELWQKAIAFDEVQCQAAVIIECGECLRRFRVDYRLVNAIPIPKLLENRTKRKFTDRFAFFSRKRTTSITPMSPP